nr:Chain F, EscG/YscG/SsaH family type III secretion system needle protein co-chaperone [Edwardsiella piscicida]7Y6C_U Chain U, EscG/YscG/SsaH family type III secretion system needle protein co-chaperone [Edwardsiella piscicida]
NNDPQAMLKAQFAMQQYSVMIGYQSSVMKTVKDMMMSIISKIG